jgi:hypothetical protein
VYISGQETLAAPASWPIGRPSPLGQAPTHLILWRLNPIQLWPHSRLASSTSNLTMYIRLLRLSFAASWDFVNATTTCNSCENSCVNRPVPGLQYVRLEQTVPAPATSQKNCSRKACGSTNHPLITHELCRDGRRGCLVRGSFRARSASSRV